ncbi:MAG: CBS domain-containing protein [Bacteroidetes bacterium]|nr:CBS domain-containing protein [Bacteroidota bacterium]
MHTPVAKLLRPRGGVCHTSPDVSVAEVVRILHERNFGSILILDSESKIQGIFTERDLLRRVVAVGLDPESTDIRSVMTRDVFVVDKSTSRIDVHQIMERKHIRHVPVMDDKTVLGVISLRDILRSENEEKDFEIDQLKGYVTSKPYPSYPR